MSSNSTPTPNANATPASSAQAKLALQQKQLIELTNKFKQLVNEAKAVGENTPRGKELLIQASKLKAIYENFTKQRQAQIQQLQQQQLQQQQLQQQQQQTQNAIRPNTNASNVSNANIVNQSTPVGATPVSTTSSTPNTNTSSNSSTQIANIIKQILTAEQNQQYDNLVKNFLAKRTSIKDKHAFLKQNIDKLTQEINNNSNNNDVNVKKNLEIKRNELITNLKQLSLEFSKIHEEFKNDKKTFYVECAKQNPALQKLLQKSTQQAQQAQQSQGQPSQQTTPQQIPQQAQQSQNAQTQEPQVQTPQSKNANSNNQPNLVPGANPADTTNPDRLPITNVNAAASANVKNNQAKSVIFKQSDPTVPISDNVTLEPTELIPYKSNRPSLTGGAAMSAAALNVPPLTTLPPYEIDTERVMAKRKLRELIKNVGIDEGDGETVIDGDVEELLLDLADDFVTNVTSFACRLAKHRKSENLESRDIQLHLERNWNIRIPGYSGDEIRSTRKWLPTQAFSQKLQSINNDKSNPSNTSKTTAKNSSQASK
ncbi:hypothetical protein TPHA_0A01560 [Tetrapisispora phaffii CBS 4417]|uniref:TBP-associated factor 12 n=1 Tax=Tetrapisispora phaffii (strain ATCC 24235 / CBS 4417 / NBRC 1672 / NRRL Y-8282 / UCD 70-5) TaxID=1071381 RepID=G8BMW1_TETPH|nr:hypothetical protein TPHA_0A01560 [Tetrapisispora phaffii CBS 4417]CCE61239.1 hypothetical protein TPHA_0A01560 [Tetrapisispora phaffii CBS 4417]